MSIKYNTAVAAETIRNMVANGSPDELGELLVRFNDVLVMLYKTRGQATRPTMDSLMSELPGVIHPLRG